MNKQELYDDICTVLTEFEQVDLSNLKNWSDTINAIEDMYTVLVYIQNNWNELIGEQDG